MSFSPNLPSILSIDNNAQMSTAKFINLIGVENHSENCIITGKNKKQYYIQTTNFRNHDVAFVYVIRKGEGQLSMVLTNYKAYFNQF